MSMKEPVHSEFAIIKLKLKFVSVKVSFEFVVTYWKKKGAACTVSSV